MLALMYLVSYLFLRTITFLLDGLGLGNSKTLHCLVFLLLGFVLVRLLLVLTVWVDQHSAVECVAVSSRTLAGPGNAIHWREGKQCLVLGGIPVHTKHQCLFFLWYEFFIRCNTGEYAAYTMSEFRGHLNAAWTNTWWHNRALSGEDKKSESCKTEVPEWVEQDTEKRSLLFGSFLA